MPLNAYKKRMLSENAPTGYPRLIIPAIPTHDPDVGLNLKYLSTTYKMAVRQMNNAEDDFDD